jgi:hypothetical protein
METTTILNSLFIAALVLLTGVTGGVIYLTFVGWRDRQRREKDGKR